MKSTIVKASLRQEAGKKAANSLRKEGMVPAILYGGNDQKLLQIDERQFNHIVYTPNVYLIDLDVDGEVTRAILQDIQFHPVTDKVTHADFLMITNDSPVVISIPIKTLGNARGVINGGKLNVNRRKLKVKGLPSALTDGIEINIAPLRIGQAIKVKDIQVEGLQFLDPPNDVVISVKTSRTAVADDDEDEEGAEGAEAATEESAEA